MPLGSSCETIATKDYVLSEALVIILSLRFPMMKSFGKLLLCLLSVGTFTLGDLGEIVNSLGVIVVFSLAIVVKNFYT